MDVCQIDDDVAGQVICAGTSGRSRGGQAGCWIVLE